MHFSQRRVRLAALLFCALSGLLCIFTGRAFASAVISEIFWMGSDLGTNDEWVEIACTGSGSTPQCILDGWTLTSVNTSGAEVPLLRFGTGTLVSSGSAIVIARQPAASSRLLHEPAAVTSSMTLPNTKLLLRLYDAQGALMDTADDGIGQPMAGSNAQPPDAKASMIRINLSVSGSLTENWITAVTSLGFDEGVVIYGSPGTIDAVQSSSASGTSSSGSGAYSSSSSSDSSDSLASHSSQRSDGSSVALVSSVASSSLHSSSQNSLEPLLQIQSSSTKSEQSSSSYMRSACAAPGYILEIQSGTLSAVGPHSVNFQVLPVGGGSMTRVTCSVDFGDGAVSESCNPPSHRFVQPGASEVLALVTTHCGTTVTLTQQVEVLAPVASSSSRSSVQPTFQVDTEIYQAVSDAHPAGTRAKISAVLPNPEGQDSGDSEWIEIESTDTGIRVFRDWSIATSSKSVDLPVLTLAGGEKRKITVKELGLGSLRNTDGGIALLDPAGSEQSVIRWVEAKSGQILHHTDALQDGMRAYVTNIVDGDTFDAVAVGSADTKSFRVRLIGIDSPELHDRNPVVRRMADEAKNFISTLVEAKEVELNFDANQRDAYERVLAYVSIGGSPSVQEQILENGYAWVTTQFGFTQKQVYLAAEKIAKDAHRGIWVHPMFQIIIQEQKNGSGLLALLGDEGLKIMNREFANIRISEAFAKPLATGSGEWIELLNTGTGAIDLHHWSLDDIKDGGSKPWRIDRELVLEAGESVVFPKSVTKISLNDDGDAVRLLDPQGTEVDVLRIPKLAAGHSFAWNGDTEPEDPEEAYCSTTVPTPGSANQCISPPVKVAKVTKAKKVTTKKSTTAKKPTAAAKPDAFLASIVPQQFLEPEEDVVLTSSDISMSLSLPQVFVIVLAAVVAGAVSGAVAGRGIGFALRKTVP